MNNGGNNQSGNGNQTGDAITRLEKLAKLREEGFISEDEYQRLKNEVIGLPKRTIPSSDIHIPQGFTPPTTNTLNKRNNGGLALAFILPSLLIAVIVGYFVVASRNATGAKGSDADSSKKTGTTSTRTNGNKSNYHASSSPESAFGVEQNADGPIKGERPFWGESISEVLKINRRITNADNNRILFGRYFMAIHKLPGFADASGECYNKHLNLNRDYNLLFDEEKGVLYAFYKNKLIAGSSPMSLGTYKQVKASFDSTPELIKPISSTVVETKNYDSTFMSKINLYKRNTDNTRIYLIDLQLSGGSFSLPATLNIPNYYYSKIHDELYAQEEPPIEILKETAGDITDSSKTTSFSNQDISGVVPFSPNNQIENVTNTQVDKKNANDPMATEQLIDTPQIREANENYEKAVQYFNLKNYGEALRVSWKLIYPDDAAARQLGKADAIRRIIRNSYYNWGVHYLKAGNPLVAKKYYQDLMDFTNGKDQKGRELLTFSEKYVTSPIDELYNSYVQELNYRSLED